jgi:iron uptake system component EfeO
LWEQDTTVGGAAFADRLDADLQTLRTELAATEIPPAALAVGSAELIEEVSTGKITGEEARYSGTDLWDFAANVEGAEHGFELLEPAIEAEDAALVRAIQGLFDKLEGQLDAYRDGEGYQPAVRRAHRRRQDRDADHVGRAVRGPGHRGRRAGARGLTAINARPW